MTFADDTAIEPRTDHSWSTPIRDGWDIGGNANGGYLLALAARAMQQVGQRPDPTSITAHYLRPGAAGEANTTVSLVKTGRRFATMNATLADVDGRPVIQVLGAFSDLGAPDDGPQRVDAAPPDLPDPDDCRRVANTDGGFAPPIMDRIDLRLHPDDARFPDAPSGEARVRGWFRLLDDEPIDTIALLLAVDAFPPTAFNAKLPVAWVPTVELTCHVRARPAPGWLRCEFTTRFVTGGFLEEDGVVWDSTGRLVAQSRQLALLPRG
ncbi:MAG: thioesterase family protein [Acidimicrobiales bacterium]